MSNDTLRVVAVDGARVPARDDLGRLIRDRCWGVGPDGAPAPEHVPACAAVRRALRRGDLTLAPHVATDTDATTDDATTDDATTANAPEDLDR